MANFKDTRVSEKRFYAIPAQALTADGAADGTITIESTYCWKVGQIVNVVSTASSTRRLKIKAILSETILKLGPIDKPIFKFSDVSDLLVADTAMIELTDDAAFTGSSASNRRPVIDLHEIQRQIYEEEPTVAMRTHSVDWLGRSYGVENPLPVQLSDGDINIGTVNAELEVQLSHKDNVPDAGDIADSVRIGGTQYEAEVTSTNRLRVDSVISPPDPNDNPKDAIMCADDVVAAYTWAEIDGVRRITQIIWSSSNIATELSVTSASVQRDYTYQVADPFDLVSRADQIVLVP